MIHAQAALLHFLQRCARIPPQSHILPPNHTRASVCRRCAPAVAVLDPAAADRAGGYSAAAGPGDPGARAVLLLRVAQARRCPDCLACTRGRLSCFIMHGAKLSAAAHLAAGASLWQLMAVSLLHSASVQACMPLLS